MPFRFAKSLFRLFALAAVAIIATVTAARAQDRRTLSATGDGYAAHTLAVADDQRRYLVRRPAGGAPPKAIVLLLHGGGGTAERLIGRQTKAAPYRMWNTIADREGLLLVAPQGANGSKGKPGWNDCRNFADSGQNADDVAFLTTLVDILRREHRIHASRAYAVGTSNGGMMALRLAIERPQAFAAVASVVSSMPARSECAAPTRAVPVLMINGTEDPLVPYAGGPIATQFGGRGVAMPIEDSIRAWAKLAGGASRPMVVPMPNTTASDGSRASRQIFASRDGHAYVELIRIDGGGHVEPSRTQRYAGFIARVLGRQNGDFEMADAVWKFLSTK